MLQGIRKVRVGVRDQERAKRFWTTTMGCDIAQDETYGDERWLEVRLPDGVLLVLERSDGPDAAVAAGQPNTPVFLACDDVDATWQELVAGASRSCRSRSTCRSGGGRCSRTPRATVSRCWPELEEPPAPGITRFR
jgi:catechol 2,3-dioxygenase-like lactoylglutathione lyase family enzyme